MNNTSRMTEGSIPRAIIRFAIPLFLGNLFQQLYNSVDSLIVGNFIGNSALAAVSAPTTLIQLLIGFVQGVFLGAGVLVARYYGAKNDDGVRRSVHTTIALGLVVGVFLSIFGVLFTPTILHWMGTPEDIFELTVSYIQVYFAGAMGLLLYNACTGIMQALGDAKHPLYYLVFSSVVNIILDLMFIGVFRWGVFSAALATIIAQLFSAVLCINRLRRSQDASALRIQYLRFDSEMLSHIVRLGLPTGLQNSIISFANVIVQSNINAFGTMAVAGCGAYEKIDGFAFLSVVSFNSAITTFVGQNLGAKAYDRAKQGARFGLICSTLLAEMIGIALLLGSPALISMFTKEPEAMAYGLARLRICNPFYFLLAASHALAAVLRGAGIAKVPLYVMMGSWCIIRVTILSVFVPLFQSIKVVFWVYPITWFISAVILAVYFAKADWVHGFEANF